MLPPTSIHSSAATRGCLCSHCSNPIGLLVNALLERAPCLVAISGDPSMATTRYACPCQLNRQFILGDPVSIQARLLLSNYYSTLKKRRFCYYYSSVAAGDPRLETPPK
jgi:hypothetical protein